MTQDWRVQLETLIDKVKSTLNFDRFTDEVTDLVGQPVESFHQYRITVNGSVGQVQDNTVNWGRTAEYIEDRGGIATLHHRLITDHTILPMLTDRTGYIVLRDKVVGPWEVLAEIEVR